MASLQQVVEQLTLLATAGTNETDDANVTSPASAPHRPLNVIASTLLSASALHDWAILLVIGSLFETARRLLTTLWHWLINSFFVTAVFGEEDISFQWIMYWLSQQPSWKGARNVQISTTNFDLRTVRMIDLNNRGQGTHSREVSYLPAASTSYVLWHNYHWMKVSRAVESDRGGWATKQTLILSIMTRDHDVLARILQDAKNRYIEARKDKIAIFIPDKYQVVDGWRELVRRPKRPLNSIILDPGLTEFVVEDVQDFLRNKKWYAERGIPFRRGYLLYGAPGSGKTSLIHSIAGELGLDVFIISLSRSGLDDTGLSELMTTLPERCIALMEDVDVAFHNSLGRESPHKSSIQTPDDPEHVHHTGPPVSTDSRVTLSGLLNALDGIGAQEGRILFATTNKYTLLDPALCRPGRMDIHIEFKLASRFQAEELFRRFYAPSSSAPAPVRATERKRENESVDVDVSGEDLCSQDLLDLSEMTPLAHSSSSSSSSPSHSLSEKPDKGDSPGPTYVGVSHCTPAPNLSLDRINAVASRFALAIPERQLSMASLQGFLMMHKARPFDAVADIRAWVEKELVERKGAEKVDGACAS